MPVKQIALRDVPSLVGQELGASDWHLVTQDEINQFARATHDPQWIHTDPERARKESPFGTTIAHGYYTLALAPYLMGQVWSISDSTLAVNYGLNKLRFPAPLPVGKSVRLRAKLLEARTILRGIQIVLEMTFESDANKKPVCVAEGVFRYYP